MKIILIILIFCDMTLCQNTNEYIYQYINKSLFPYPGILKTGEYKVEEFKIKTNEFLKLPVEKKKVIIEKPKETAFSLEQSEYLYANELLQRKLYAEAVQAFNSYIAKYPAGTFRDNALLGLGDAAFQQKNYPEAINNYSRIIETIGEKKLVDEALFKLGLAYSENKDYDKAMAQFLKITKLYPKSSRVDDAILQMGNVYRKTNDFSSALKEYNKVVQKYKNSDTADEAWFYIGNIYENVPELRDFEKAVNSYKKILILYPKSKWYSAAEERIEFINKNFLQYK